MTARPLSVSRRLIEQRVEHKRAERGGFELGIVMVGHHEVDGRDLVPGREGG